MRRPRYIGGKRKRARHASPLREAARTRIIVGRGRPLCLPDTLCPGTRWKAEQRWTRRPSGGLIVRRGFGSTVWYLSGELAWSFIHPSGTPSCPAFSGTRTTKLSGLPALRSCVPSSPEAADVCKFENRGTGILPVNHGRDAHATIFLVPGPGLCPGTAERPEALPQLLTYRCTPEHLQCSLSRREPTCEGVEAEPRIELSVSGQSPATRGNYRIP
jgi:hypothetical protein